MSRFDDYDRDFDFDSLFQKDAGAEPPMDFVKENGEEYDTGGFVKENAAPAETGRHLRESDTPRYEAPPRPAQNPGRAADRDGYGDYDSGAYDSSAYDGGDGYDDGYGEEYDDGYDEEPELPRRGSRRGRSDKDDYEDYREWQESGGRSRSRGVGAPLVIVLVLLVGGILFAGWKLGTILLNYQKDRSAYNDLALEVVSTPPQVTAGPEEAAPVETPGLPIHVNWAELRQQNSDVVGWLYCPNTIINYPVVQRQDEEFYLNHGFNQQPNTSGALFADFDSVAGVQMSNFIIYGHNMKDNSMFGTLTNYTDPSYWDQNPTFYYLTPNGNYRIELICAHIVESTINNFPSRFGSTTEYQSYLNQISTSSFWVNASAMNTSYQLITLSTCSYTSGYEDPRFLVHGIMIPVED